MEFKDDVDVLDSIIKEVFSDSLIENFIDSFGELVWRITPKHCYLIEVVLHPYRSSEINLTINVFVTDTYNLTVERRKIYHGNVPLSNRNFYITILNNYMFFG